MAVAELYTQVGGSARPAGGRGAGRRPGADADCPGRPGHTCTPGAGRAGRRRKARGVSGTRASFARCRLRSGLVPARWECAPLGVSAPRWECAPLEVRPSASWETERGFRAPRDRACVSLSRNLSAFLRPSHPKQSRGGKASVCELPDLWNPLNSCDRSILCPAPARAFRLLAVAVAVIAPASRAPGRSGGVGVGTRCLSEKPSKNFLG